MTDATVDRPRRFWTPGFTALMAGALAALIVLLSLGNWQVRRLAWKEDLLTTIETRMASEPASLASIEAQWKRSGDVEYVPATVRGAFEPGEALFYATDRGTVGWQVLSPFRLEDGRVLVVNRGFVPDASRDPATRPPPPEGTIALEGLARNPLLEKPGRFVPDNTDVFYWKDYRALLAALDLSADETLPFLLDRGLPGERYPLTELPVPGQTIVSLPNNHFGYAVTWYGIAVALVGVVAALAWGRWRKMRGARPS